MIGAGQRPARHHARHIVEADTDSGRLVTSYEMEADAGSLLPLFSYFLNIFLIAGRTVQEFDGQVIGRHRFTPHFHGVRNATGRGSRGIQHGCTIEMRNKGFRLVSLPRTRCFILAATCKEQQHNR